MSSSIAALSGEETYGRAEDYMAYAIRDDQGVVVGLRLVFISQSEFAPKKQNEDAPKPDEGKGDR